MQLGTRSTGRTRPELFDSLRRSFDRYPGAPDRGHRVRAGAAGRRAGGHPRAGRGPRRAGPLAARVEAVLAPTPRAPLRAQPVPRPEERPAGRASTATGRRWWACRRWTWTARCGWRWAAAGRAATASGRAGPRPTCGSPPAAGGRTLAGEPRPPAPEVLDRLYLAAPAGARCRSARWPLRRWSRRRPASTTTTRSAAPPSPPTCGRASTPTGSPGRCWTRLAAERWPAGLPHRPRRRDREPAGELRRAGGGHHRGHLRASGGAGARVPHLPEHADRGLGHPARRRGRAGGALPAPATPSPSPPPSASWR